MYWSMHSRIREYIGSSRLCAYHTEIWSNLAKSIYIHSNSRIRQVQRFFFHKSLGLTISSNDHCFLHWTKQKKVQIFITKIMKKIHVANKRKYIPSLQKMFKFEQNKKKTSISSTSETMQIWSWWCRQFGWENKPKIVIPKKYQFY